MLLVTEQCSSFGIKGHNSISIVSVNCSVTFGSITQFAGGHVYSLSIFIVGNVNHLNPLKLMRKSLINIPNEILLISRGKKEQNNLDE